MSAQTTAKIATLTKKLEEAKKANDQEKVARLSEKIRNQRKEGKKGARGASKETSRANEGRKQKMHSVVTHALSDDPTHDPITRGLTQLMMGGDIIEHRFDSDSDTETDYTGGDDSQGTESLGDETGSSSGGGRITRETSEFNIQSSPSNVFKQAYSKRDESDSDEDPAVVRQGSVFSEA